MILTCNVCGFQLMNATADQVSQPCDALTRMGRCRGTYCLMRADDVDVAVERLANMGDPDAQAVLKFTSASLIQDHANTAAQPAPRAGAASVTDAVIADMLARREQGTRKYGTELMSHNGRDALVDAYQEALDLVVYLKQTLIERDFIGTCYVMADGECISPFTCIHGDGIPLDEFVRRVLDHSAGKADSPSSDPISFMDLRRRGHP